MHYEEKGRLSCDSDAPQVGSAWSDWTRVVKVNRCKTNCLKTRVKDPLNYSLMGTLIPEVSSCKYLRNILRSDLSWADHVNYAVKKTWKALHFTMRILKKGNSNTKSLAYMSLVRPILECGAGCWDPYREGQINALDRVQKKAAKFAHHKNSPNWETLASRRKLSRICALFKAYSGKCAWKPLSDRLKWPHYLSSVAHDRKIRSRRQRTDIGRYSFVNRTIQHWNQLPAEVLGILPCKQITFKKRVRKVIIERN